MPTQLLNMDCMEYMKNCGDGFFDLAIVDPPYGIGADKANNSNRGKNGFNEYHATDWDAYAPQAEYFEELKRISKNQIVWGGNYFVEFIDPKMCWIVWDKKQDNFSFSDGELAWTSFSTKLKFFRCSRSYATSSEGGRIHPTQKPVKLYKWLLENYAEQGQTILDTHLGSGSSAIAAHYFGCDFTGLEIDEDYFNAAQKRFAHETRQISMF